MTGITSPGFTQFTQGHSHPNWRDRYHVAHSAGWDYQAGRKSSSIISVHA